MVRLHTLGKMQLYFRYVQVRASEGSRLCHRNLRKFHTAAALCSQHNMASTLAASYTVKM